APVSTTDGGGWIINFGPPPWHLRHGRTPARLIAKAHAAGLAHRLARAGGPVNPPLTPSGPRRLMREGRKKRWPPPQRQQLALPHGQRMLEAAGNFGHLRIAAGRSNGRYRGPVCMDSDVYKWLEAAACEIARAPSAWLASTSKEAIDLVAAAQGADGYINSYYTVAEPGKRRTDLAHGHELCCAGRLIQAAGALPRATGAARL